MADSMCGPSNGAKNLLAHVDRDRSHHQDRLVNALQPGSAFRSQTTFTNGAEAAFGGFQQGSMPMDAALGPGLDMNAFGHVAPFAAGGRPYGHALPSAPMAMANTGPAAAAARLGSPATGGTSHQEWVSQFSNMQIGPGAAGPSNAMPAQAHVAPMAQMNPAMTMQQTAFGMPRYGAGAAPGMYGYHNPVMNTVAQQPQIQTTTNVAQDTAVDVEAFNRAFGEYDDTNFETDLADWTEKQKLANSEFAEAQDQWMAEHGPSAGTDATATNTVAQPPTAAEMEEIDADLERLAQEQEAKKRSDDELARAAVDIVNSVADNTSEKFRKSKFFELMRRIGNREVVVEGDSFVNAVTGETVVTSHDDGDDVYDIDGVKVNGPGVGSDAATHGNTNGAVPVQGDERGQVAH